MPLQSAFVAFLLTILSIKLLYPVALKIGLTDRPCHRKQHKAPTPLIGGLASYLAIVAVLLVNENIFPNQFAYLLASSLLVIVGLIDDYKNLGVRVRLVAQVVAVLIMTEGAGLMVTDLGDLVACGNIDLCAFSTLFTVFAVVGGINAFNMIDGIDGLAGGLTLISISAIAIMAWLFQDMQLFNFCCVFIAVILGFLLFNLRIFGRTNAKIFLGDTGSTLFGFTVCWLSIYASQGEQAIISPVLVLWLMAIPLIDSVCIMCRRLMKGRSPFAADREHLHHILLLAGYSINQVVAALLSTAFILVTIGIAFSLSLRFADEVLFLFFLVLFTGYFWCMNHAWMMMKIARYLRTKHGGIERDGDRRKAERRINTAISSFTLERRALQGNRRVIAERRYIPSQEQLSAVNKRKPALKNLQV
ncbi:MAG: hypothetical protein ABL903_01400 [Methylococcales bacterium]